MQIELTISNKNRSLDLIKPSKVLLASVLVTVLASCGGGGPDTSNYTNPSTTITSITPVGIVTSSTPQSLSILGTNFSSGMTLNVTDKNGVGYMVSAIAVSSSSVITASVDITATPVDNYVNVTIMSSNGAPLATAALGVASASQTLLADVQPIFDSKCGTCHDGSAAIGYLDMRNFAASASANATGLIGIPSYNCSSKFRVMPGDPRRTSSVLIDKIQAHSGQAPCSGGPMPPASSPQLSPTEIQTIIDWVAGGAN